MQCYVHKPSSIEASCDCTCPSSMCSLQIAGTTSRLCSGRSCLSPFRPITRPVKTSLLLPLACLLRSCSRLASHSAQRNTSSAPADALRNCDELGSRSMTHLPLRETKLHLSSPLCLQPGFFFEGSSDDAGCDGQVAVVSGVVLAIGVSALGSEYAREASGLPSSTHSD